MAKSKGNPIASIDRRTFLAGSAASMAALSITIPADKARAAGFPERAITLVVMYGAGGGTDTIMRKLAEEMANSKGWKINVINKPGAVGGVATQYVHGQASDGYTVLGGANYNKFVRVMGHVDFVPWEEWVFFQAATANASWSVPIDSPFKTFDDVVAAAKADPGKITISTSGTGGLWHELALIVGSFADVSLKYVPYKGGKAATLAGLQGEVDIAGGGVHEHVDLVRAGKLRCLQQTSTADIDLGDGKVMPTIGGLLPSIQPFLPIGGTYNFIMKRDTPTEVLQAVNDAFIEAVNSDGFQDMVKSKFFQTDIRTGEAADKRAALLEVVTVDTFNKFSDQIGADVVTAQDLGLPKPADFESWWPPAGYKPRI
ncbi:tripartite tricarboxylate transporter substrate binding protein [Nitratireductor sp. XY-223]|uniref:Bug family tripartite tricarboxylate transporter substrate binding protein n=1 Tax=Nitratireductor sp. XY-223 TaxID=2561926 RepID=UPI00145B5DBA|nr:tripartite tricarboxylate transporter substrate binding protein [Nitratireductor sp. XY-223]